MKDAFEKLKGVDIFSLKSYMEPTDFGSFNGVWVMINEIFVNLFFFLLNAIVGFFSLLIKILESIDLYSTYKTYVYNGAKTIWQGFTENSSGGIGQNSLVGMMLLVSAIYLFIKYFLSRGSIVKTVLHVSLVILLALSYFGTIAGNSGGLYLLDTINNVSQTVSQKLTKVSVTYDKDKTIKVGQSLSDNYLSETSYKAYLFVNTGQENGKYKNTKDGKEEPLDHRKILGTQKGNVFTPSKTKERDDYLDEIGDGANEDNEQNRWVSAVPDFIFIRVFYVIFKCIEAIVIAIPIIIVQLLNVVAQILVLIMILLFPIVLLVSFIPKMQGLIFGVLKVMFGGLIFPAITSFITLIIFYIEKMIETLITSNFDNVIKTLPSLLLFGVVFKLLLTVVSKLAVYFFLWKYKGELMQTILGSKARVMTNDISRQLASGVQRGKTISSQAPKMALQSAQSLGNFTLASAGLTAGMAFHSKAHLSQLAGAFKASPGVLKKEKLTPNRSFHSDSVSPKVNEEDYEPQARKRNLTTTDTIPKDIPTESDMAQPAPPIQEKVEREEEFQSLKRNYLSPIAKHRINHLERQLETYKEPESMFKAQGSNPFTKNYRKTLTKNDKIKANIERRDRLTQRLKELRGETL